MDHFLIFGPSWAQNTILPYIKEEVIYTNNLFLIFKFILFSSYFMELNISGGVERDLCLGLQTNKQ